MLYEVPLVDETWLPSAAASLGAEDRLEPKDAPHKIGGPEKMLKASESRWVTCVVTSVGTVIPLRSGENTAARVSITDSSPFSISCFCTNELGI